MDTSADLLVPCMPQSYSEEYSGISNPSASTLFDNGAYYLYHDKEEDTAAHFGHSAFINPNSDLQMLSLQASHSSDYLHGSGLDSGATMASANSHPSSFQLHQPDVSSTKRGEAEEVGVAYGQSAQTAVRDLTRPDAAPGCPRIHPLHATPSRMQGTQAYQQPGVGARGQILGPAMFHTFSEFVNEDADCGGAYAFLGGSHHMPSYDPLMYEGAGGGMMELAGSARQFGHPEHPGHHYPGMGEPSYLLPSMHINPAMIQAGVGEAGCPESQVTLDGGMGAATLMESSHAFHAAALHAQGQHPHLLPPYPGLHSGLLVGSQEELYRSGTAEGQDADALAASEAAEQHHHHHRALLMMSGVSGLEEHYAHHLPAGHAFAQPSDEHHAHHLKHVHQLQYHMHPDQLEQEGLLLGPGGEALTLAPLGTPPPAPKKKNRGSGVPTNIQATDNLDRKTLKRMRNRVSASRCRVKRKEWITTLEEETDAIHVENTELSQRMEELDQAIRYYRNVLATLSAGGVLEGSEAETALVPPFVGKNGEVAPTFLQRKLQASELDPLPIPAGLSASPSLLLGGSGASGATGRVADLREEEELRDTLNHAAVPASKPTASTSSSTVRRPW